ncbi:MAG: hypothetical protein NWE86_00285 [Candidatus Bathyarchaeota archaeon]|nr:hypothetical protein [Candidatus Bathyarchaeota archaeon]
MVVTLFPDSCENYEDFLRMHLYNITGIKFDRDVYKKFKKLSVKAKRERNKHLSLLKAGRVELFDKLNNIKDIDFN